MFPLMLGRSAIIASRMFSFIRSAANSCGASRLDTVIISFLCLCFTLTLGFPFHTQLHIHSYIPDCFLQKHISAWMQSCILDSQQKNRFLPYFTHKIFPSKNTSACISNYNVNVPSYHSICSKLHKPRRFGISSNAAAWDKRLDFLQRKGYSPTPRTFLWYT